MDIIWQIILLLGDPEYLTFCSTLGWEPPEDSVPQPVIQQSVPAGTVVSGRQAAPTPGPKSKGGSTLNNMRSLLYWAGEL